ncbi:MAG TPA: DUF6010 family protein [Chloroflexota bacterium]|nr:DUF6010 family protein [Chloroflexota bacterium]
MLAVTRDTKVVSESETPFAEATAGPTDHKETAMSTLATSAHDQRQPSLFARRPILTAIVVGAGSLLPHAFLPREASLGLAANLIALIAGIDFGFAVVNGSGRHQMIEFNVTSLFAVAGLLGMLYWPLMLPIAYLAHAGWDLAHHNRARLSLVAIPSWYVPWCVVIDVIVGAGLFILWRTDGIL